MFITFEGIDGSGKSTQARLLAEELKRRGLTVCRVREPGGTPLGETIRGMLLDTEASITPRAELLLFSAARAQLVEAVIEPALARGEIVIADRFYDSTTAYQGAGRGVASPDWLEAFHGFVVNEVRPDRTYFLDMDPAEARDRVRSRSEDDRMEGSGLDFYERAASAYRTLARSDASRLLTLDATETARESHEQILKDLAAWNLEA